MCGILETPSNGTVKLAEHAKHEADASFASHSEVLFWDKYITFNIFEELILNCVVIILKKRLSISLAFLLTLTKCLQYNLIFVIKEIENKNVIGNLLRTASNVFVTNINVFISFVFDSLLWNTGPNF